MYNPDRFKESDPAKAVDIMNRFPFATLISVDQGQPWISHLPLVAEGEGENLVLFGHLARANPHWRLMHQQEIYIVFQGPHSYITPKWYAENDVPTWNYVAVHVRGRCELMEGAAEITGCLQKLTQLMEKGLPGAWEFWIPPDLAGRLEQSIVGFQVKVTSINAKFKLSQNRTKDDREGVARGLRSRPDDFSQQIGRLMDCE